MLRWLKSTFVGIGALTLLGGCAKTPGAEQPLILRELARSYLIGTTYDQALIASRQEDGRALRNAVNRLEELNAMDIAVSLQLSGAEDRVRSGERLLMQAYQIKPQDPAQSHLLLGQAGMKFRSALRWSPDFPSRDPELLNSLGYYLADHGHSTQDFESAEQFTSRAVTILEKTIQDNAKTGVLKGQLLRALQQQQAITRDSQAWALYKLKRFDEAESVQAAALAQAKISKLDNMAFSELWMHQAKILQAQGKTDAATAAEKRSQEIKVRR